MRLHYHPNTSVEAHRVTPSSIVAVAVWTEVGKIVDKDMTHGPLPPLERCIHIKGRDGSNQVALMGDWILKNEDGSFVRKTHEDVSRMFVAPVNSHLDQMLASRDIIPSQYGLTRAQSMMLANLQAIKKMICIDKMKNYHFNGRINGLDSWYVHSEDAGLTLKANLSDCVEELRKHFFTRVSWVCHAQENENMRFGGLFDMPRAEQEKWLARVILPSRILAEPDAFDMMYLQNYERVVRAVVPGAQVKSGVLVKLIPGQQAWVTYNESRRESGVMSQSFAESLVWDRARTEVRNDYVGADAEVEYAQMTPIDRERLIGEKIDSFIAACSEAEPSSRARHRG